MEFSKLTRVAIYIRVSTTMQAENGESLNVQRTQLTTYAQMMLNALPENIVIFEDAGYSGKNMDRPKFQDMMSQIRAGKFSHLLVWKIDRISRNLLDFSMMYKELKELGVTFVSKNEQFDTSTAMGEAMLKIILVFAELERNMTSERVTHTMIAMAQSGRWNGGRVPFGYTYRTEGEKKEKQIFEIDKGEAALVQEIFDLYEQERSIVREAKILNDRNAISRYGHEWSPVTVHLVLRNIFYVGDYRYNALREGDRSKPKPESEWIIVKDHHPAIISREQFARVQAILKANKRYRKDMAPASSRERIHIFGGLLFCGNCGKPLNNSVSNKKADGWQYSNYPCPTRRRSSNKCTGKSTSDPVVGEFVFNYILNMLNAQKGFKDIQTPAQLQDRLLFGDAFHNVISIDSDGLNSFFNLLSSGNISGAIYGKDVAVSKPKTAKVDPELVRLRKEKKRLERALDRLLNTYIMSDRPISENEYIRKRTDLETLLSDVNDKLGIAQSEEVQMALTDSEFLTKASQFIIGQKLSNRLYINYKNLAQSVDPSVLKTFVVSVIDNIVIYNGKVKSIVFRNGLAATFEYSSI